jgi:hypothetical protein
MKARFVNEKFSENTDPIKDMEIGDIAVKRKKVRSHEWNMTKDFLNKILSEDFGYEEYMGYAILTYYAGNRWWSITSWRDRQNLVTSSVIASSGGQTSLTKESSIKNIKSKIRRKKRVQKQLKDDESKIY